MNQSGNVGLELDGKVPFELGQLEKRTTMMIVREPFEQDGVSPMALVPV
jgi:hypothetical protein